MKLLLIHDGSYYLIDLEDIKPKTLREVVIEAGDDKLMLAQSSELAQTDLDAMLARAFSVKAPEAPAQRKATPGKTGLDPQVVRAWCKEKGITVNDKGRVPQDIAKQYLDAHT
jgi:hypothetical protein